MSVNNFNQLKHHVGHDIQCVMYGYDQNVALECHDCSEILLDFDAYEDDDNEDVL